MSLSLSKLSLSTLAPVKGSRQKRVRVGRGESSGLGKTSGRGGKGQTARTGGGVRVGFEGGQMPLYRRLGKLGFNSQQKVRGDNQYTVFNLTILNKFADGEEANPETLAAKGYKISAKTKAGIKILGRGELNKKVSVKVHAISESAKAAIEAKGGSVTIL